MTTDAFIYLNIYLRVAISLDKVTTEGPVFSFLKKCFLTAERFFFFLRNKPEEVAVPL